MLILGMATFRRAADVSRVGVIVLALLAGLVVSVAWKPGTAHAAGPPARIITYEVRGLDNGSNLEDFAAQAAETYADPRGWSLGGAVAFVRVPSGGSFTLWLSAPSRVPGFGSPCSSLYSCRQGRNVIINEARWLGGSPAWNASGASLRDYRHMVVNHETGHWIAFGHAFCSGAGRPAPVMQQQTISLQGCAPNSWPLDNERRSAAAVLGVAIRYGEPFGFLEAVRPWLRSVRVQGWAIDPDTAAPDVVQITVDGAPSFTAAALARSDIAAAFPGYGAGHGFDAVIPAAAGAHRVCAYAMNVAGGGSNALLGCRDRRCRLTVRHGRADPERAPHRAGLGMGDRPGHARGHVGARVRQWRRDRHPRGSRRARMSDTPFPSPDRTTVSTRSSPRLRERTACVSTGSTRPGPARTPRWSAAPSPSAGHRSARSTRSPRVRG